MTTGFTALSPMNYELNAGVFLKNFDYSTAISTETGTVNLDVLNGLIFAALTSREGLIGATTGGGSFSMVPTIRQTEADGQRAQAVGSTVIDLWTITLNGTMKEITPQNFMDALITGEINVIKPSTGGTGGVTRVKVRNDLTQCDYIPSLCWVGDMGDGGLILINITNALNLSGAEFTFEDKGEGSIPFSFQAHQGAGSDMKYAPVDIIFFQGGGTTSCPVGTQQNPAPAIPAP